MNNHKRCEQKKNNSVWTRIWKFCHIDIEAISLFPSDTVHTLVLILSHCLCHKWAIWCSEAGLACHINQIGGVKRILYFNINRIDWCSNFMAVNRVGTVSPDGAWQKTQRPPAPLRLLSKVCLHPQSSMLTCVCRDIDRKILTLHGLQAKMSSHC